ncbi:MAG TPA: hypothetical protein VKX31_02010 [Brumimicrobium sp.]|nr:hypothetical protein [Brumimicrobium sp.]
MTVEDKKRIRNEEEKKILKGLELTYQRLIQFKKEKNSVLVIMQGDKIVQIKPK